MNSDARQATMGIMAAIIKGFDLVSVTIANASRPNGDRGKTSSPFHAVETAEKIMEEVEKKHWGYEG